MGKDKSFLNKYAWDKQRGLNGYNQGRLFTQFSLMAKNRFKWEGLPEGIDSRHIEEYLFEHGQVAFFEDDKLGLMCLPCSDTGKLNVYGDALEYTVTGINYTNLLGSDEIVRVMSNDNAVPSFLQVSYYTDLLDEIEHTIWLNLRQQKFPYLISSTKNNEFTMKNIYKKLEQGEPAIFIDDRLTQGGKVGIEVIETNAPFLLKDLQEYKNEVMNELMTWLGLNNTNNDKKERLLVDEVNVNNNHILMNLDIEYKLRELACKEINKKFGTNIEVIKTIDTLGVDFIGEIQPRIEEDN